MKMKKTAIVLAVLMASLFAVSCQKENNPEATGFAPMTINAVSEGIGVTTKVEMAYKYDLLWQNNDEILVKNTTKSAVFALNGGAGTTKGTFSCNASPFQDGDAVEAFYPKSIVDGENLVWPATLTNNQTVPMYSTKTLSATEDETFSFSSLGSVFQLIFSTTSKDVVLQSIELKADEAMSGVFTINNGQAVMPTEGDKPGITLDLETGVALGVAAKKFNIAVPAGIYNNLTITLTAKDGRVCEIKAKNAQTIAYNTVSTLTLNKKFISTTIEGSVLPGKFSVNSNKKVYFSKGNLWMDDDNTLYFEDEQVKFNAIFDGIHISYFSSTWFDNLVSEGNVSVGGSEPIFKALSSEELQYLFSFDNSTIKGGGNYDNDTRRGLYKIGVTVCGIANCVVIAPDDWNLIENPLQDEYNSTSSPMTWNQAEEAGLVCLPAAGCLSGYGADGVGNVGFYWTYSLFNTYEDNKVPYVFFDGECLKPNYKDDRGMLPNLTIRLVTDVVTE